MLLCFAKVEYNSMLLILYSHFNGFVNFKVPLLTINSSDSKDTIAPGSDITQPRISISRVSNTA